MPRYDYECPACHHCEERNIPVSQIEQRDDQWHEQCPEFETIRAKPHLYPEDLWLRFDIKGIRMVKLNNWNGISLVMKGAVAKRLTEKAKLMQKIGQVEGFDESRQ